MIGFATLFASLLLAGTAVADGNGLIGYGKTMYYPLCASACRGAIGSATLVCTPHDHSGGGGHGHSKTPPECYATDKVFMQTLAFCISQHCPREEFTPDVVETYWTRHLVGGARIKLYPRPKLSYAEALESIQVEPKTEYVSGEMLNVTSLVADSDYESQVNALGLFETVEIGHGRYR
jgi:hypothetical protein